MNTPTAIPFEVSVDEAVARLINLDAIPAGYTIADLTEGFLQEAEDEYRQTKQDGTDEHTLRRLEIRIQVCKHRHQLGKMLMDAIPLEIHHGRLSAKMQGFSPIAYLDWAQVREWAEENFGLSVVEPVIHVIQKKIPEIEDEPGDDASTQKLDRFIGNALGKISTKNLLVTFNFLVRRYADKRPDMFIRSDGSLNQIKLSEELALDIAQTSGKRPVLDGQSVEAIKRRIVASIEAWRLMVRTGK